MYTNFLSSKVLKKSLSIGNSLRGHISLVFAKEYPEMVESLVLTGSSGLYENAMGDSFSKKR